MFTETTEILNQLFVSRETWLGINGPTILAGLCSRIHFTDKAILSPVKIMMADTEFQIKIPPFLGQTYIWAWAWRWRWRRSWGWCWTRRRWTSPRGQPWSPSHSGGWTWSGPDNVAGNDLTVIPGGRRQLVQPGLSSLTAPLVSFSLNRTSLGKQIRGQQATLSDFCLTWPSSITRSWLYLEARLWLLRSHVTRGRGLPVTKKHCHTFCLAAVWLRPCKSIFMSSDSRLLLSKVWVGGPETVNKFQ